MTIQEHLKLQLIPKVYELAIANCKTQHRDYLLDKSLEETEITENECLSVSFIWQYTPEGYNFWKEINSQLKVDY